MFEFKIDIIVFEHKTEHTFQLGWINFNFFDHPNIFLFDTEFVYTFSTVELIFLIRTAKMGFDLLMCFRVNLRLMHFVIIA